MRAEARVKIELEVYVGEVKRTGRLGRRPQGSYSPGSVDEDARAGCGRPKVGDAGNGGLSFELWDRYDVRLVDWLSRESRDRELLSSL